MHLQFTGVQSKFKTEIIENNNLAKLEIGKAILPTPMIFSPDHVLRERPFNLKGGGGGGGVLCFFFKTIILIPNVADKNILILVEGKKIIWFRVFVI